jgi:hypothetical protein
VLVYVRYGSILTSTFYRTRPEVMSRVWYLKTLPSTMDTQSILKTAIAEHEDSQSNGITLESLTVEAEARLKDLGSVCPSLG